MHADVLFGGVVRHRRRGHLAPDGPDREPGVIRRLDVEIAREALEVVRLRRRRPSLTPRAKVRDEPRVVPGE